LKDLEENMARAKGVSLPISSKQSIEICAFIRGKKLNKVLDYFDEVISHKKAIPFRRFNRDMGHKKGIGPGRYPVKAISEIRKVLLSVQTNAQYKGLNTSNLKIIHVVSNKASSPLHYGRRPRRSMKRTHVEVVVQETSPKKKRSDAQKKDSEKLQKGQKASAVKSLQDVKKETPVKSKETTSTPENIKTKKEASVDVVKKTIKNKNVPKQEKQLPSDSSDVSNDTGIEKDVVDKVKETAKKTKTLKGPDTKDQDPKDKKAVPEDKK